MEESADRVFRVGGGWFLGLIVGADAVDDDVDAADVFHGHFRDFFADIFLYLYSDFCEGDAEAEDDAYFDEVVAGFVFGDADTAIGVFFGKELSEAFNEVGADGIDAIDFGGCDASDVGDDGVVNSDVAEVAWIFVDHGDAFCEVNIFHIFIKG